MAVWETVVLAAGAACAGGFGFGAWRFAESVRRRALRRNRVRRLGEGSANSAAEGTAAASLDGRLIAFAATRSRELSSGAARRLVPDVLVRSAWIEERAPMAGLEGRVTPEGFADARAVQALLGLAMGMAAGAVFSVELVGVLGAVGLVLGWRALPGAVGRRVLVRAQEMERHLPEMLEVVALGMRSGLSFDRSVALYVEHFDTLLAGAFGLAQSQWTCGLVRRDEALRKIAASYDSPVFGRVVEGIIRSLRFGSSMVEGLEAAAGEVRASYRARRQEEVAKAPVKMMIPTGTLILPAMLILVLGPVLLELMGGF